jgi:hypothetical protein
MWNENVAAQSGQEIAFYQLLIEMKQKGLLNFKSLVKTVKICRMTNNTEGETVSWQKI